MEKNTTQPNENMQVAKFDPAEIYRGASSLSLTETEMKALSAPFNDLDYEIRPDGFIYLPQALSLQRLNAVIGIGKWGLLLINSGKDDLGNGLFKVFYDGAMVIRNCFVSRSVGEAQYSRNNNNQSWASAFEAAKSDCRQRCCKDLGIANDAWNPSFIRRWQKEHAIKVFIEDNGKKKPVWRRKDVDPFWNEIGPVLSAPTVPDNGQVKEELPWLNHGPDYDSVLRELLNCQTTIKTVKATRFRISKQTEQALVDVITRHWVDQTDLCNDLPALTKLYNDNQTWIEGHEFVKTVFTNRRLIVIKAKTKVA